MHAHLRPALAAVALSLGASCGGAEFTGAPDAGGSPPADGGADAIVAEGGGGGDGACADTTSDSENCGRCGHSCVGGTCSKGLCQPILLAQGEPLPQGIVAFTELSKRSRIFWPDYAGNGGLRECRFGPALGCTPKTIVPGGQPRGVVRNSSSLFWFRTAPPLAPAVLSLGSNCVDCSMPNLVATTPNPIAGGSMAAGDALTFWTDDGFGASGHVYGCQSAGCTATLKAIVTGSASFTEGIAFDEPSSIVYYADGNTIKSCPAAVALCVPTTIVDLSATQVPNTPAGIVVYKHLLYWASPVDGAVATCDPTVDCKGTLKLAAGNLGAPVALAVDATGIYVTEIDKIINPDCTGPTGKVEMCPLTGCGASSPVTLADHQLCPIGVALTDNAIVWANRGHTGGADGSVVAIARP